MAHGRGKGAAEDVDYDRFECSANDLAGKDFILTFCFVLPRRVDPEELRTALYMAIERKMRRAGARLAKCGKIFKFHIPRAFSAQVPPCSFTARAVESALADLPLPPQPYDAGDDEPCFMPGLTKDVAALFRASPSPLQSLADALKPGTPMLHAHITTLRDGTLVGLTAPHVLFDVHGAKLLLLAWTTALRGSQALDEIAVAPLDYAPLIRPALEEALEGAKTKANVGTREDDSEPVRGFFALGFLATVQFVVSLLWRLLRDPKETEVLIRVPKAWLQQQKAAATAELAARGGGEWVSTSDVLLAWLFRTVHAHRTDNTHVALHSAVNLRPLLPALASVPYMHNAVHAVVVRPPIPAARLGAQSVLDTALALRRALNALKADAPRLLVELAEQARHPTRTLYPARPGEQWAIATNWLSAGFLDLDFGSGSGNGGESESVRPLWFTAFRQDEVSLPLRGTGAVHCEDEEAIWATWTMAAGELRALRLTNRVQFRDYLLS